MYLLMRLCIWLSLKKKMWVSCHACGSHTDMMVRADGIAVCPRCRTIVRAVDKFKCDACGCAGAVQGQPCKTCGSAVGPGGPTDGNIILAVRKVAEDVERREQRS